MMSQGGTFAPSHLVTRGGTGAVVKSSRVVDRKIPEKKATPNFARILQEKGRILNRSTMGFEKNGNVLHLRLT